MIADILRRNSSIRFFSSIIGLSCDVIIMAVSFILQITPPDLLGCALQVILTVAGVYPYFKFGEDNKMKFKTVLFSIILIAVLLSPACGPNKPPQPGGAPDKSTVTEGVMATSVDNDSKPTSPVKTSFPVDTAVV
jgi:hypothetical protein